MKQLFDEFPIINSREYLLRKIEIEDYLDVYEIYSDKVALTYQAMDSLKSHEEAKKYIQNILTCYDKKIFLRWVIEDKKTSKVIGLIALHHINVEEKTAQIGYILNRKYWNHKIMTENLSLVLNFLQDKKYFNLIRAEIHPDNLPSIKLAKKLGFIEADYKKDVVFNDILNRYEDRLILEKELVI